MTADEFRWLVLTDRGVEEDVVSAPGREEIPVQPSGEVTPEQDTPKVLRSIAKRDEKEGSATNK